MASVRLLKGGYCRGRDSGGLSLWFRGLDGGSRHDAQRAEQTSFDVAEKSGADWPGEWAARESRLVEVADVLAACHGIVRQPALARRQCDMRWGGAKVGGDGDGQDAVGKLIAHIGGDDEGGSEARRSCSSG